MSKIPVKPFQPLPPLVRMERIRDTPKVRNTSTTATSPNNRNNSRNTEDAWMMDSPTNRSVALLVSNSSGISHHDATTLHTTTPNDPTSNHSDLLWNPLMTTMMMMDDTDVDHIIDVGVEDGPLLESYYPTSPHAVSTAAKRVSLDVVSDTCDMMMMDVDTTHHESLLQQYHPHQDLTMMTSTDHHDHEFELMEGLEHDPLLTLSVTCGGVNEMIGTTTSDHNTNTRLSNLPNFTESSVPHRLPSLRRLLSAHDNDYNDDDDDVDHDDMNDPWTNAANEAAFQMTSSSTNNAFDDDDQNDLMVFEIDQSFLKANGHTTTVGTESTVSSYSSVSPDLLSVFHDGDNNHHHHSSNTMTTVPTFFTSQQFQERCQLLSESMRASQLSRQCLSLQENIKLRANLAKVLKDIERSTAKVQRHCLSQQIQPSQPTVEHDTAVDKNEINNDSFANFETNDIVNNDHDTTTEIPITTTDIVDPITTNTTTPSSSE